MGDPLRPGMGNGGYDVRSYDIGLRWEPSHDIRGVTRIAARTTQRLTRFNLDLSGLTIEAVTVNGREARFRQAGAEVEVTPADALPASSSMDVEVRYAGRPEAPLGDGGWFRRDGEAFVFGQPESAARWFPANDHPIDKAAYVIRLDVPEGFRAVANGTLARRTTEGGRTTFVYRQPVPQATYLTTLAIGRFDIRDGGRTERGIPIGNVLLSGVPEDRLAALRPQARMIDRFGALFGPFPFQSYGATVVTGLGGLALEGQTRSIFDESLLGAPDAEDIVAHEIVHQWIGNHVSVERWRDLWVNEGWATYGSALWREATDPRFSWDTWARDLQDEHGAAMDGTPPASPPPGLFVPSVYFRAAMALHALRLEIGDGAFRAAAREHVRRHGSGNASGEDFLRTAERAAGTDLGTWYRDWIVAPALPERLGSLVLRDPSAPGTAAPSSRRPLLEASGR